MDDLPLPVDGPLPADGLFAEARRQLTICNACRYCEGYCAVFPALERRTVLEDPDITHLANLCHDCRACFTACMYAPPHEFAVNPPAVLSEVRRRTYDDYLPKLPRPPWTGLPWMRGRAGVAALAVVAAAGVAALALAVPGGGPAGSPYRVIAYPALLVLVALPCAWGVAVLAMAAARYWRQTAGSFRGLLNGRAWLAATRHAATLRYLRGGGADCSYPTDVPSAARRRLHGCVAYGFLACAGSTIAAAAEQDLAGVRPPYPVVSVPVLLGIAGGLGLMAGCAGLIWLRRRADPASSDPGMTSRDYGLLIALEILAVSGLLTLVLRQTPVYAGVLALHIAAVVTCFCMVPYTKFSHVVYRFLALVHDSAEAPGRQ
ncbi:MAG: tricarballylate utilization 4Fe-4S protein TcuB [Nocardiopsaceae bacterium]|nr:tricarballylate utilization 4Fe-4S protein TcuB [Nocardiopsaceae bacterium]